MSNFKEDAAKVFNLRELMKQGLKEVQAVQAAAKAEAAAKATSKP